MEPQLSAGGNVPEQAEYSLVQQVQQAARKGNSNSRAGVKAFKQHTSNAEPQNFC